MRSFVKIKSSRNGEITLSFTDEGKSCHDRDFLRRKYVFKAIRENKILARISESTVVTIGIKETFGHRPYHNSHRPYRGEKNWNKTL